MADLFKKFINMFAADGLPVDLTMLKRDGKLRTLTDRELINLESEIGAKLFGPVPKGHRREFFCLDEKTWIWHEEWLDHNGALQVATTRYEIQPTGVLKSQAGAKYSYVTGKELTHLVYAIRLYYEQVARHIYGRDPKTGEKLV